ncbi:MAG TPA: hypothetical protein VGN86_05370 [Pyrinomonadaceae bacterium]|jgi:hypothetical protein|nr:hypothetical protein [Pyrinomonadaceae bacterium]
MSFRGIKLSFIFQALWLTSTLSIWQIGIGSCLTEPNCATARYRIWPLLWDLSFPASFILYLINDLVVRLGFVIELREPIQYVLLGLGVIFVGYLQWFCILPYLFRKKDFVILLPAQIESPGSQINRENNSPGLESGRFALFDNEGRTPLERAMIGKNDQTTNVS